VPTQATAAHDWLDSPQGAQLLVSEATEMRRVLEGVFGDHLVQIGAWGGTAFIEAARTRRSFVIADAPTGSASLRSHLDELSIASDSVDAVLLPHILESHADPHTVLREAERILRPDGRLIVSGFNPHGFWGVRHLVSRRCFPPGAGHLISERRLRDWLRLLNLSVRDSHFYYFRLPFARVPRADTDLQVHDSPPAWAARNTVTRQMHGVMSSLWHRVSTWPPFGACYITTARKEMYTVTPVRQVWRRRRRLVGGLVNPSTRNAA
jgi:SAM-dependent methyltransferase